MGLLSIQFSLPLVNRRLVYERRGVGLHLWLSVGLVSDEVCDKGSRWTDGYVASVSLPEKVTKKTRRLYLQSEDYYS